MGECLVLSFFDPLWRIHPCKTQIPCSILHRDFSALSTRDDLNSRVNSSRKYLRIKLMASPGAGLLWLLSLYSYSGGSKVDKESLEARILNF